MNPRRKKTRSGGAAGQNSPIKAKSRRLAPEGDERRSCWGRFEIVLFVESPLDASWWK